MKTLRGTVGRSPLLFHLLLLPLLLRVSAPSAASAEFQAGAAAVEITPTNLPIRTAGSLTLTVMHQVRDALYARALVLDDGATRIALATVDSCMVAREDLDAAKELASGITGIPVAQMLLSSTHSHTAPAVYGCHGNDAEPAYRAYLVPRIADAIVQAWRNRVPARVAWGRTDLPEYVHCRRWLMQPGTALHPNPAFTGQATNLAMMNPGHANTNRIHPTGPVDPAVTVLALQTREGKPLAWYANYSTHYGPVPSEGISADYFGEFCRVVARDWGAGNPKFVALLSNGTSGDVNWIDLRQPDKRYSVTNQAVAVAQAAARALRGASYRDSVPLGMAESRLRLSVRRPTAEQAALARAFLASNVVNRPTRTWEENYARETTLMADGPATQEIKLQAVRIGDLALGAIPCEVFAGTGLKVKAASPFSPTLVVGLANGCSGYLPPPDQFALGGYTTWRARTSFLEVDAERLIAAEIVRLLRQVRSGRAFP